eukprot:GFUD01034985.1.p1 GENE.GFUD01034985.1~~GFUD01034985.1.p1  ORF type:complete len:161 (+),score=36.11 GFUD01034985.1:60-485(+)
MWTPWAPCTDQDGNINRPNKFCRKRGNEKQDKYVSSNGVELISGSSWTEGNLFVDGKPVHDWGWYGDGKANAKVVCRMLGFNNGDPTMQSKFGPVDQVFGMGYVRCIGTETNIQSCYHNCNRYCDRVYARKAAGVICSDPF